MARENEGTQASGVASQKKSEQDALLPKKGMPNLGLSSGSMLAILGMPVTPKAASTVLQLGRLAVGPSTIDEPAAEDKGGKGAAESLPAGGLLAKLRKLAEGEGEGKGEEKKKPADSKVDLDPLAKAADQLTQLGKKVIEEFRAVVGKAEGDKKSQGKETGAKGGGAKEGGGTGAGKDAPKNAPGGEGKSGQDGPSLADLGEKIVKGMASKLAKPPAFKKGELETTKIKMKDAAKLKTATDEISKYEAILAAEKKKVAQQAEEDAKKHPEAPTEAMKAAAFQSKLDEAHKKFYEVDLGNGIKIPVPYMVNYSSETWVARKTSEARKVGKKKLSEDKAAFRYMGYGKGSADDNQKVLKQILEKQPWTSLSASAKKQFDKKAAAMMPPNATKEQKLGIYTLAYAQVAGLGTDCAGYVQYMLEDMGALPPSQNTNVTGLTKGMGTEVKGSRSTKGKKLVRPCDDKGNVVVKPGHMIKIHGNGHIGLVHMVVKKGDEIILKYAHSTPGQAVFGVTGQIGVKPEGVREDIVVWNTKTNKWKAVRCAYSTSKLNGGFFSGFYEVSPTRAKKWTAKYQDSRKTPKTPES